MESLSLEVFKKHGGVALMCMGGGGLAIGLVDLRGLSNQMIL